MSGSAALNKPYSYHPRGPLSTTAGSLALSSLSTIGNLSRRAAAAAVMRMRGFKKEEEEEEEEKKRKRKKNGSSDTSNEVEDDFLLVQDESASMEWSGDQSAYVRPAPRILPTLPQALSTVTTVWNIAAVAATNATTTAASNAISEVISEVMTPDTNMPALAQGNVNHHARLQTREPGRGDGHAGYRQGQPSKAEEGRGFKRYLNREEGGLEKHLQGSNARRGEGQGDGKIEAEKKVKVRNEDCDPSRRRAVESASTCLRNLGGSMRRKRELRMR
ncbi:MAG: hypothetical protein M1827_005933 [Pycnora praestabilis]|nr:MAG: hypothetical protein M1827_005933 [Pycnora praestabilis]